MTRYIQISNKEKLDLIKQLGTKVPIPSCVPAGTTIVGIYYTARKDLSLYGHPWQVAFVVDSLRDLESFESQYKQGYRVDREFYEMSQENIKTLLQEN